MIFSIAKMQILILTENNRETFQLRSAAHEVTRSLSSFVRPFVRLSVRSCHFFILKIFCSLKPTIMLPIVLGVIFYMWCNITKALKLQFEAENWCRVWSCSLKWKIDVKIEVWSCSIKYLCSIYVAGLIFKHVHPPALAPIYNCHSQSPTHTSYIILNS